jgi:two-component system, OmpR family, phosphate regulon sensor histidine kinase PhoR
MDNTAKPSVDSTPAGEIPIPPRRHRSRLAAALASAMSAWRGEAPVPSAKAREVATLAGDPIIGFVAALDLPFVLLDLDLRVVAASRGALKLMPALGVGKPISLGLRDPDALAAIEATLANGQPTSVEIHERTPPERTYRLNVARMTRDRAGDLIQLSLEDLSAIRAIERLRVDFIANASHELRTPLATLLGFIETLQGPAREDATARGRFLGIMYEQARRMSRLVDDLLSLSRIEQRAHQAPAEKLNLANIVREIVDSLSVMAAERGVVVESLHSGEPVIVAGDRDELLRLVENLIENAIKYGRDGQRVRVDVVTAGDQAELSVRDFGPGIQPEHIPRLTERFYRIDVGVSREAGGTGLGLAIVKHIVLRHRGRLLVESTPGEGACFRVILPLHPDAGPAQTT